MTKQEIYSKYGDVPLKFSAYKEFYFKYSGKAPDGAFILASIGGNSDDVYSIEVIAEKLETIRSLEPDMVFIDGVAVI